MGHDNLASFPHTGELPGGLYKPPIDENQGYWSPWLYFVTSSFIGTGAAPNLAWTTPMVVTGFVDGWLVYTQIPILADGSFWNFRVRGLQRIGNQRPVMNYEVVMTPGSNWTITEPVTLFADTTIDSTRTETNRQFSLIFDAAAVDPPACWSVTTMRYSVTMQNPLDPRMDVNVLNHPHCGL